jgi:hypothetical protein
MYTKFILRFLVAGMWLIIIGQCLSCKSTKASIADTEALSALEKHLQQKHYRVDMIAAFPYNTAATTAVLNNVMLSNLGNTASRIDINGKGYYIEINDSITKAFLPFYGEQRLVGGRYGGDAMGINFNTQPKHYGITRHKKKNALVVKFGVSDSVDTSESYDVIMTFFTNNNVEVVIMSSHRTGINYRGSFNILE